ncbi:hypothetical protein SKAU_G00190870 [Synaphobranchus kaupii]|uniref:Uncharacterized protein n=1 Tax=Synaphobranchus kaupii TaxID=118154 RepID=A0A9Q1FE10_SYNKA|nr:hypothetical protein SKAU_G00190870 [Synaphobranchus kaupii]
MGRAGGSCEEEEWGLVILCGLPAAGHDDSLKLQPQKWQFLKKEMYLGHIIGPRGVAMDPEKTAAVRDWPQPEPVHQVWAFLGFAGYYRPFILAFAHITAPIKQLLVGTVAPERKTQPITWTAECQQVFEEPDGESVSHSQAGECDEDGG